MARQTREVGLLTQRARQNRKEPTKAERLLWNELRGQRHGIVFRRQHPIGNYIVDFYCSKARLIVEIDGWSHESTAEYDIAREIWLRGEGFAIVRLDNIEVIRGASECATALFDYASALIGKQPFPRFSSAEDQTT